MKTARPSLECLEHREVLSAGIPLTNLGPGVFQGFEGGLYPNGQDVPPAAYLAAGENGSPPALLI